MTVPRFSVITPVYNTPEVVLRQCIESVLSQTFQDWELILADDASQHDYVRNILRSYEQADERVRVVMRSQNGGIVAASNDCLTLANGEFVALLDHDDLLDSEALERVNAVLEEDVDIVYTDEDKTRDGHHFFHPFRKPSWSPERLRSHMYVLHLAVYRMSLVRELGGFRAGFDGSQDYDLCLRASERARRIVHVPEILYHWRVLPASVAADPLAKPYAYTSAVRALDEHLERVGISGHVEMLEIAGNYRTHRAIVGDPTVSIVIPTAGKAGTVFGRPRCFVVEAVRGIVERSSYREVEFVVVYDAATPEDVLNDLRESAGDRLVAVRYDRPFNFASKINKGALLATGDYLVLLNDDTDVITPDWLEQMLGVCQQPDVGMVGAKLLFEDDTVQHVGHCYWAHAPGHIGFGVPRGAPGPLAEYLIDREVSGVTAACAMIPRDLFIAVGGLTRRLPSNYNDVDLSMKVRQRGYRIVVTPQALLYHFESKSRRARIVPYEASVLLARWGRLMGTDPYWREPLAAG